MWTVDRALQARLIRLAGSSNSSVSVTNRSRAADRGTERWRLELSGVAGEYRSDAIKKRKAW